MVNRQDDPFTRSISNKQTQTSKFLTVFTYIFELFYIFATIDFILPLKVRLLKSTK